jgi:hypothetical protein
VTRYALAMPRYEKIGRTKESLFELVVSGRCIYTVDGERPKGEAVWEINDRGARCYFFDDAAAARAKFDERCSGLVAKKYVLAGEDAPHANAMRIEYEHERKPPTEGPAIAFRQMFADARKIRWTHPDGDIFEIALHDSYLTVEVLRRGVTKKYPHPTLERALNTAMTQMVIAADVLGYTPT